MQINCPTQHRSAGFSLIELMIAMTVTLVVMTIASSLLAQSLNIRSRENERIEALADAQRALNMMTRDIANAGCGLTSNGIVAADSDNLQIRVRSNLDYFPDSTSTSDSDTSDPDEDVVYAIITNTTGGAPQLLITRQDINSANAVTQIANRVDGLQFNYYDSTGALLAAGQAGSASKVKMTITITLGSVGTRGQAGYQPGSQTQLTSEVALRNKDLTNF